MATILSNLGNVLRDLGDLAGAREDFQRAQEIFRGLLGDEHPDTILARRDLESLTP